ncbi:LysR family transcriptional regulator [Stella humosa]|uniref:LysR family transcriptional regulator n=1 Tax=Stella humosa TaxID=94 RepID=A0A3N1KXF2_9PROT|nr:LysR family transcriptional regulator [Stella humosa]ROP83449.1 LysR family transcriptional regulator [Stella humosa]BBK33279.1 transcriptional regulator [Stella humosa]
MDRVEAMRLFVRVAELGSLSAAARRSGLSVASVSRGMGELEAGLGVRLFARTTRRQALTEAGQEYHRRAVVILDQLDALHGDLRRGERRPGGVLRVLARRSFALRHVAPHLAAFARLYPELAVDLLLTEAHPATFPDEVDVVIRLGAPIEKGLAARELAPATRHLCAARAYLEGRPAIAHPDDLRRHDCLIYRTGQPRPAWVFESAAGRYELRLGGSLVANSGEVLRQAAVDGQGVALLPEWQVGDDVAAGRLVRLLADYRAYPEGFAEAVYAIHPRAEFVPAKVTAFVDFLREAIKPSGT